MANGGADLIKEDIEARKDEASSNEDFTKEDLKDVSEIETTIKNNLATHLLDPNMDVGVVDTAENALEKGDVKAEASLEQWLEFDSPYPEVRAAASNVDDPTMPVNTFRMWFLGLFFTVVLNFVDQFIYYRYPSVRINSLVIQLVSLPTGKLFAKILPTKVWKTPFGEFTLNPGPFNAKEHTCIVLMSNVTYQGAYATDIFAAQKFFYGQNPGWNYSALTVMSTQIIGFSYAGFCRRWLVWPAAALWPTALVSTALMTALHRIKDGAEGGPSRFRWFVYIFTGAFFWYFLPGYLFTALSVFAWADWIAPNNVKLNQLMGSSSQGLGMGGLTFDWLNVTYITSPLVTPWWAEANIMAGFIIFVWILAPSLYYSNHWNSAYLPIISSRSFDRFGKKYDVTRILTPEKTFDENLYAAYSEQYLPVTLVISYGLSFASLTALISHIWLYCRHDIARQFKSARGDKGDVHARLMQAYKEVPLWWYGLAFIISLVFGIIAIEIYDTQMPVWALFVAIVIGAGFTLPIGIIYAITNNELGLNVITEFIIGYMVPGKPVSMMLFKTYGYISMYQALNFVSDQKFAHYMKIPPRITFMCQMIAVIVANLVVVGTQLLAFSVIENICMPDALDDFTCPNTTVFATASVVWGLIGPQKNFSAGQKYTNLLYFFLVGAVVPIPTYFLTKRFPRSFLRYVNWPTIFGGIGLLPPATGINYTSWLFVGFVFNYLIRKYRFNWWSNYNYVTSAGLDSGTGICSLVIFFCLALPNGPQRNLVWWGNTVNDETADSNGVPWLTPDPVRGFAPAPNGTW